MALQTDGHSTTISFASDPTVLFEEKEATPPGVEGGGENDTTTMANTAWRTRQPKQLKTLSPASLVVAYDPATLTEILALINVNNLITVTFPDTATWEFWGWMDTFTPSANVEGEQPTADITIIPSNQSTSSGTPETAPTYTAP